LKAHYPVEFWLDISSTEINNTDINFDFRGEW